MEVWDAFLLLQRKNDLLPLGTQKESSALPRIVEGKKIDHPGLIQEKRARMKILLFDPGKDIPVRTINGLLKKVLSLYKR
jgi:hypothetical protein